MINFFGRENKKAFQKMNLKGFFVDKSGTFNQSI